MTITYEEVTPALIPNTTMQKMLTDGVHKTYRIQAVKGYVLHDNRIDDIAPEGNVVLNFKTGSTTVSASYDFTVVTNGTFTYTDENGVRQSIIVQKIGEYEFYTLPEDVVPSNQIFGGGNSDHEVM